MDANLPLTLRLSSVPWLSLIVLLPAAMALLMHCFQVMTRSITVPRNLPSAPSRRSRADAGVFSQHSTRVIAVSSL